jgi:hypothetical protein
MTTVALIPYRPQLPAVQHNEVQRLGAAILRTLDRIGIRAGQTGVLFERVRIHRGEFISFELGTQSLTPEDQALILNAVTRDRLQKMMPQPIAIAREAEHILIVIDLRPPTRSWRVRLRRWLKQ